MNCSRATKTSSTKLGNSSSLTQTSIITLLSLELFLGYGDVFVALSFRHRHGLTYIHDTERMVSRPPSLASALVSLCHWPFVVKVFLIWVGGLVTGLNREFHAELQVQPPVSYVHTSFRCYCVDLCVGYLLHDDLSLNQLSCYECKIVLFYF